MLKIHRHFRSRHKPYRLVFTPDPICWTEIPSDFRALRRQRHGWQRGIWEVLWERRSMLFNPRYGHVGMIGVPYLWIFEASAALIELLGYAYIIATAALGLLNVRFAILFFALAILYGVLLSEMAMGIETLLLSRYSSFRDRVALFAAAFVEYIGIHQALVVVRAIALFQVKRYRGRYWTTERKGIPGPSLPDPEHAKAQEAA